MANLGPLYQNATYGNLLQIDGGLSAELKPVLDGDGNASGLTLSLTSVGISGLVADTASNLYGGLPGLVPYQVDTGVTGFVPAGSLGQVFTSNGSLAPSWSTLTASSIGALASDGSIPMTGQLSLGYNKIVQVGAPSGDYDAANKGYVDSVATGLQVKTACRVATTANLSLTGAATVDGVAVATSDRVLVKNQTASAENGIYVANTSGAWTRATDANTWAELVGAAAFITAGSTQANTTWVTNIAAGGTLGTDPVTFVQFGASTAYTAGTGLTLTGSQFALSSPVSIANGGTGQTTQANAINALLPSQTGYSGRFLSTDGTQAYWSVVSPYNPAAVAITGGTINGTTIGGSTPAAGTFSSLSVTLAGSNTVNLNSFISVNSTAAFLRNPRIWNPAETYWYRITPSPITQDVYATLPQLAGNDTFVFAGHAQTLTNKTLTSPTISGGTISGITDLAIADGGTGASDATTARSNLGLAIGTNVQAYNAGLTDIAGLAKTDSNFIVGNGTNWVAESGATARTSLGLGNIATISTTGSTTNFLRADGTWAAPTSTSTGWTLSGSTTYTSDNIILSSAITSPITSGDAQYCNVQFTKGGQNTVGSIVGAFQSSNDNSAGGFYAFKTRNASPATQAAVQLGDDIGEFGAHGSDGAQYVKNAFLTFVMEGTAYSSGANSYSPCGINFWTRDRTLSSASSYSGALKRALVIDSNQNVGVTNGKFSIGLDPTSGAPLNGSYTFTHQTSATGIAAATYYVSSTGGGSVINTSNGFSSTVPVYGFWYDQNTGIGNPASSVTSIVSNAVEQARFWNNSRVSFGTSTVPTYLTFATKNYYGSNVWAFGPDATDFYVTQNSGSYLGVKLTWGATSWTTTSDERRKDIIEPISDALAKVSSLRSVIGKYKTDDPTMRRAMLIAQDFENVFPEALDDVNLGEETVLGLRYTDVIPLLVAAVKELIAKVEALEQANG